MHVQLRATSTGEHKQIMAYPEQAPALCASVRRARPPVRKLAPGGHHLTRRTHDVHTLIATSDVCAAAALTGKLLKVRLAGRCGKSQTLQQGPPWLQARDSRYDWGVVQTRICHGRLQSIETPHKRHTDGCVMARAVRHATLARQHHEGPALGRIGARASHTHRATRACRLYTCGLAPAWPAARR